MGEEEGRAWLKSAFVGFLGSPALRITASQYIGAYNYLSSSKAGKIILANELCYYSKFEYYFDDGRLISLKETAHRLFREATVGNEGGEILGKACFEYAQFLQSEIRLGHSDLWRLNEIEDLYKKAQEKRHPNAVQARFQFYLDIARSHYETAKNKLREEPSIFHPSFAKNEYELAQVFLGKAKELHKKDINKDEESLEINTAEDDWRELLAKAYLNEGICLQYRMHYGYCRTSHDFEEIENCYIKAGKLHHNIRPDVPYQGDKNHPDAIHHLNSLYEEWAEHYYQSAKADIRTGKASSSFIIEIAGLLVTLSDKTQVLQCADTLAKINSIKSRWDSLQKSEQKKVKERETQKSKETRQEDGKEISEFRGRELANERKTRSEFVSQDCTPKPPILTQYPLSLDLKSRIPTAVQQEAGTSSLSQQEAVTLPSNKRKQQTDPELTQVKRTKIQNT